MSYPLSTYLKVILDCFWWTGHNFAWRVLIAAVILYLISLSTGIEETARIVKQNQFGLISISIIGAFVFEFPQHELAGIMNILGFVGGILGCIWATLNPLFLMTGINNIVKALSGVKE